MEINLENLDYIFRNDKVFINRRMLETLFEYVDKEKIEQIYPKNLFVDEKELEIYVFTKEKIIVITSLREQNKKCNNVYIKLNVIKKQSINNLIITNEDNNTREVQLEIILKDGQKICFNNIDDTNKTHQNNFKKLIQKLSKSLL